MPNKPITLEGILEKLDEKIAMDAEDDYGWHYDSMKDGMEYIQQELRDFITAHFTELLESLRLETDFKQHICAYNDGECNCPCYREALIDLHCKINNALGK